MQPLLLITPPFTQLNTPYPGTAYLKGFLNTKNIYCVQMDLGIETILKLFSADGLSQMFAFSELKFDTNNNQINDNCKRIFALRDNYITTIDAVIGFLQGKNPILALQICQDDFLPEASRFQNLDELDVVFGSMGTQDKAKHLATLYLEDISDFVVAHVDSNFGFSRYAERLGRSANSFDDLYEALQQDLSFIDEIAIAILHQKIMDQNPKMVCFSVPFPGNLYSAFRCAQHIKKHFPDIKIEMGGGFPNTELRSLSDKRVFEFFDFIMLDDGELPLELLVNHVFSEKAETEIELKRTFVLENEAVVYKNNTLRKDYKQSEVGTPDYSDLRLDQYISVIEIMNPMHRMWSDGRWNKLTMAHGCYWGKCTFCDISLDYIKLYEPVAAAIIVDRMQEMMMQTGQSGFHFVDEAAPPALMREVALEILRRKIAVTWWTNIRFEKSFTDGLCRLLKASGCIAVSGGLEVASDRLLKLIDKGVTVQQVAVVTNNFTNAGIMVHAYLMYGYPTQTIQETIDSLEMVRQMFEAGILQSGFWHQFAMTAHSPVGLNPDVFGVMPIVNAGLTNENKIFAINDVAFKDKTGIDHDKFSFGLKKSLYNFMQGYCLDFDLDDWFDFKIPKTKIDPNFIDDALQTTENIFVKPNAKIVWLGSKPTYEKFVKSKKGTQFEMLLLTFHTKKESFAIKVDQNHGQWLIEILYNSGIENKKMKTFADLKTDFESKFGDFEPFWYSKEINILKSHDLIVF